MTTELCTYTRNACDIARRTGVERIELCAAPLEGGTTPSAGLIRYARSLPGLRLSVMIRPRGGDFLYTDDEVALMAEEIRLAREYGADGVVFGLLTPDGEVDETRTAQLVREAEGMEVTFHRAFDMTRDSRQALEAVIRTGCRRVLTSGGRNTAQEGIETLRALAAQATGRIEIMAGSGVGPSNARLLAATGVDALHFSARRERESGMRFRNPQVSMRRRSRIHPDRCRRERRAADPYRARLTQEIRASDAAAPRQKKTNSTAETTPRRSPARLSVLGNQRPVHPQQGTCAVQRAAPRGGGSGRRKIRLTR